MDTTKFAERVAGYATITVASFLMEDVMWPAVMIWQGKIVGGIIMFFVALLGSLIQIWAYDKLKKDLFALETLRELTEQVEKTWSYDKVKQDIPASVCRELTEQELNEFFKPLLVKFVNHLVIFLFVGMRLWKYFFAWIRLRLIKTGRLTAFVALSLYDPFLAVIYIRKGVEKYKMEKRDWLYFFLAMVIGCAGWTFWWSIIITVVKKLSCWI